VTVNGRNAARGAAALAALGGASNSVFFSEGNVRDYETAARVVADAASRGGGRLDVLVSAGAEGPSGPKPFHEMTPRELEDGFAARVLPRIFPVHAAVPALRAAGGGAVLLITTDAARHPTPGEAIIGATGAAVILLTKALAREFSRWNTRVNALALTLTSGTPSWDRIFSAQTFENRLFSKALTRFPFGRAPTAEEVARVAAFLVSPQASQVTGQTVSVNGGLSFGGW
jgi:3-oxoacyl-[acyl-carrier protein] reductase